MIIPVYCFDPRQFDKTSNGFPKTGRHRTRFLIESVQNLRENSQKIGANLIVRSLKAEDIIPVIVDKFEADFLFTYSEPAREEEAVEDVLKQAISIDTTFFGGHSLYHLRDIPYEPEQVPKTFTNFRKQVEKRSTVRGCFPNPGKIKLPKDIEAGDIPTVSELGVQEASPDSRSVLPFNGGEQAASDRLNTYFWEQDQPPGVQLPVNLAKELVDQALGGQRLAEPPEGAKVGDFLV